MPFERKVENKKEKINKIEEITKKLKSSEKSSRKSRARVLAQENAELLFDLLHGSKSAGKREKSKSTKSRSLIF